MEPRKILCLTNFRLTDGIFDISIVSSDLYIRLNLFFFQHLVTADTIFVLLPRLLHYRIVVRLHWVILKDDNLQEQPIFLVYEILQRFDMRVELTL